MFGDSFFSVLVPICVLVRVASRTLTNEHQISLIVSERKVLWLELARGSILRILHTFNRLQNSPFREA